MKTGKIYINLDQIRVVVCKPETETFEVWYTGEEDPVEYDFNPLRCDKLFGMRNWAHN